MTPREQELTKALVSALNLIEWLRHRMNPASSYPVEVEMCTKAIREALVEKEAK